MHNTTGMCIQLDVFYLSQTIVLSFSPIKFGICADGIKELFGTSIPDFKGDYSFHDRQAIFKVVSVKHHI